MENIITLKTSSPSGDTISFMAGMRQLWKDTGKKCILYHRLGMIGGSYEGADSAYEDENKNPICFNKYTFDMMHPLMLSQEYVEDYIVFDGQVHEIDLDKVRLEGFTNQPKGNLARWPNYVFPQMSSDLSKPSISVSRGTKCEDKIIVNFTVRHRNTVLNYFFLKQYEENLIFAGLPKERDLFCKEWNLNIPLLEVKDFLELAQEIRCCNFFIGNQSFCFLLSEAIKVPRLLETFPMMPNVIPVGEDAYDQYHQGGMEYIFYKLFNKTNNERQNKTIT